MRIGTVQTAKFTHNESSTGLRLQVFLTVRDETRRVATVRLEDDPQSWLLPGEMLWLNEDPMEAARRVAKLWFASGVKDLRLASVESYPATGPEDDRWYLIFVFEAASDGELKGTPDTLEIKWTEPGKAPGPWGKAHADVWERVK